MWSTLSAAWQTRTSMRDSRLHMLIRLMYPTAASPDVGESYVPGWQNSTRSGADSKGMVPVRSCAPAHEIQSE